MTDGAGQAGRAPLLLVAGFLGAGKTSLLRRLVPRLGALGREPHVVLNDVLGAEVDAALFAGLRAEVTALSGSCVCCGSREELLDLLDGLDPGPRGVLLLEANGTTDTEDLLGFLAVDPRARRCFLPPIQVTVVDAARWQHRAWQDELERDQARTASHLFLNWTHRAGPERSAAVRADVARLTPLAPWVDEAALADLLTRDLSPVTGQPSPVAPDHRQASRHRHPFAALDLPLPPVVGRDELEAFVRGLPAAVVRAKGLVALAEDPSRRWVFSRVAEEDQVFLEECVDPPALAPVAIFIGAGLPVDELASRVTALAGARAARAGV